MYLLHFPIIILGAAVFPGAGVLYYVGTVLAIIFVSVFAYELAEKPIYKSDWLTGKKKWTKAVRVNETYKNKGLVFLAGLTVVAGFVVFQPTPKVTASYAIPEAPASAPTAAETPEEQATRLLSTQIAAGVTLATFPETDPSIEEPGLWKPEQMEAGAQCLNPVELSNSSTCTYGSGEKLAVVVGDSVAMSWIPAVVAALEPHGYRVHGVGLSDCPFADVEVAIEDNPASSLACNNSKEVIQEQIAELKPDLVVASDFEYNIIRLASEATGEAAIVEWRDGLSR